MAVMCTGLLFTACEDEDKSALTEKESAAVEDQSVTEAYFNGAGELSTTAYNTPSDGQIGGRSKATITLTVSGDTRFNGAKVTLETAANNSALNPQGKITIDFGTGQTDPRGDVRKGKIIVTYRGIRFIPGSVTETTFEGFEQNGVKIEGKRTNTTTSLTSGNAGVTIKFTVVDVNGKATFSDGTFVTRSAEHSHTILLTSSPDKNMWTVEGTASGDTREKVKYVFAISRPLVFKGSCALAGIALPAEGAALFTVGTVPITLNYGDAGAPCDDKVEVTVNGVKQEITVNG